MSRRRLPALLLALVVFAVSGCGSIRGERVETGMAEPRVLDLDAASATTEAAGAPDETAATDGTAAPEVVVDRADAEEMAGTQAWTAQPQAFEFLAPELFTGGQLSGTELYESGPVLMTFVSPGCPVSIEEGPAFAEFAEANSTIAVVFVHTDGDTESFKAFVEENDLYQENVIHIDGSDRMLWNRFEIQTQPSTVLVDANGFASVSSGGLGHEGLTEATELLTGRA